MNWDCATVLPGHKFEAPEASDDMTPFCPRGKSSLDSRPKWRPLEATVTRHHTENQQRFDRLQVRADEVFQTTTTKDELTAMENRLKDEMAAMEERLLEAIRAVVPPTPYGS